MPQPHYCWRCQMVMPMLEKGEAEYVFAPARSSFYGDVAPQILERYHEVTGFEETNVNAVLHHVLSIYGPPCSACGKLLRTPRARLCAARGAPVGYPGINSPAAYRIRKIAPADIVAVHDLSDWPTEEDRDSTWRPEPSRIAKNPVFGPGVEELSASNV